MRTSEQTDQISLALSKAQGEMKNPEKNRTAEIPTKAGGKYSFNYADLPSIYDAVRGALSKNGLSHTFGTEIFEGHTICVCRLAHSSGQWIESQITLPPSADIKSLAGNLTYLRRYLFSALVGIAGDDDVDGEPEHPDASYTPRGKSPTPPEHKAAPKAALPSAASQGSAMDMFKAAMGAGWDKEQLVAWLYQKYRVKNTKDVPAERVSEAILELRKGPPKEDNIAH